MPENAGPLGHKMKAVEEMKRHKYTNSSVIKEMVDAGDLSKRKLDAMRKQGLGDEQILHFLITGEELDMSRGGITAINRGFGVGLSQIADVPTQLATGVVEGAKKITQQLPANSPFANPAPEPTNVPSGGDFVKRQLNRLGGENFAYDSLADLPRRDRPLAAAGEVVGANAALAVPVFGGAKLGAFGRLGDVIRKNPLKVGTAEAVSTLGAAQGAAVGELLYEDTGRLAGELVGGAFNPTSMLFKYVGKTKDAVFDYIKTLRKSGRQDKLAKILTDAMEEAGEDPGALAEILRKEGLVSGLTAGQLTGSRTLQILETKLARENAKFGGQLAEKTKQAADDFQSLIAAMNLSGDPELIKRAAQLQSDRIADILESTFQTAQRKLTERRARFPDERNMAGPSAEAHKILDDALKDARAVEKAEYWDKVAKDVTVADVSSISATYKNLEARRLKVDSDKLPSLIREQNTRIKKLLAGDADELKKGPLNSGELIIFRSRMLAEARKATSQKDWDTANIYNEMAAAVLEDLGKINAPGFKEAREFSTKLHDAFSRTFAGDVLSLGREGAERINPELMLTRAFGPGKEVGDLRFRELEAAAQFSGKSIKQEQDAFLRSAATASRKDGVFSPQQLEAFLAKNEETLKRFPDIARDLRDLKNAEARLAGWDKNTKVTLLTRQRAAYESLINAEDSTAGIIKAFKSDFPQKEYSALAVIAKRAGPGAVGGLKAATMDAAYNQALRADGTLDWSKYRSWLLMPVSNRGPSPLKIMEQQGIMSRMEVANLQRILHAVGKLESTITRGTIEGLSGLADPLFDLAVRIFGAQASQLTMAGQAAGPSLVIAGAGVRFARNLFENVPISKMQDVAIEASSNPKIMADLLLRTSSPAKKKAAAGRIRLWLITSGFAAPEKLEPRIKDIHSH